MGKVWKNGGQEDQMIKKLIRSGKINKYTKPSSLKNNYVQTFGDFSLNVIRNHLNLLKMSEGLMVGEENESDGDVEVIGESQSNSTTATSERSEQHKSLDDITPGFGGIFHKNYPILCESYKDPETASEKVALVVSLPAGAQNVTIELRDNGETATVKYFWASTMYDMTELYGKMLAKKQIDLHHPRVLCIKNGLEKCRKRNDEAPEAAIKVNFPIKVQTGGDSWSMSGVKKQDGTQVLMADFSGFVNDYHAKIRDVQFEY